MSPERPSSSQDEIPVTPKMSAPGSPVAGTPIRDAQSPLSLLLAVAQSQSIKNGDDDLTSLSWLHENDVLKGMNINPSPSSSTNSSPAKNGASFLQDQSPTSDYHDESSISAADSSNGSVNSPSPSVSSYSSVAQYQTGTQRVRHPHNIPYDPLVHTNNKPPYSFSCLIFMAIEDSKQKALPVKEIYAWILEHFPYFKNAPTGWKNSVRHNLSLNKCFQKVEKSPNLGKGSLWTVDPHYKPNLIQALNRSPFHPSPGSIVDPTLYYAKTQQNAHIEAKPSHRIPALPNPELFPYLSKKLAASELYQAGAQPNSKVDVKESLDAVDAAAVMLSLKNATRLNGNLKKDKNSLYQVITTSPSQDHTYSAADSTENGDEAFESDEDRHAKNKTCRKIDFEDEEERKIKEGAETLLNLAGIATRKRLSQFNNLENGKKMRSDTDGCPEDEKHMPFKPRLLRVKKKENSAKIVNNNNNDWVKNRKELDINQTR